MVKRCYMGQCVDHEENCQCNVCVNARELESVSVVTEQGMFGDLSEDYQIANHSERPAK